MALLLYFVPLLFMNYASASSNCDFPAIFNFGDSNSDTGGFGAAFQPPTRPNGETFFRRPAGRFSDGRLIIDFIAEGLGLTYLHAYLDALRPNFSHGVNFATAASTILPQRNVLPLGGFSPFSLNLQYIQFTRLRNDSHFIFNHDKGGVFDFLLPKKDYYSRALYTFDIGHNDMTAALFANMSISEVGGLIPYMVGNLSATVKSVYNDGGRSFWIQNTDPSGCLPYLLVNLAVPPSQIDSAGCAIPYNNLSQLYNDKLKEAVIQLRRDLPLAAITYVDIYNVKYSLISQAHKYGFEKPLVACCGYGEDEFNYSPQAPCGGTIKANGGEVFVGSCDKPSVRVNWDGVHYTEAANKFVFDQIVNGKFSDPPVSLRMACHRKAN
ncbi:hypothetical protein Sjap_021764 [Stephania japonica]|uniref:Uncharacterized protein n=1 Tax=Stephania japonica TaxID=461633 RepID=A0AAP0HT45_9MAGN